MNNSLNKEELDRRAEIITKQYAGIHPPSEAFYINSILYSAGRAREAFQRFDVARSLNDTEAFQVSSVHEALGHSGALSRFFWPSYYKKESKALRSLKEQRAKKLRAAFALTDTSALRDRGLRDFLEHFDERLDQYLLRHDSGYFFPGAQIGDSSLALADDPKGHIFKLVDPSTCCFVLLGEKHYFADLRKEVERVYELVNEMDKNGCRLRKAV